MNVYYIVYQPDVAGDHWKPVPNTKQPYFNEADALAEFNIVATRQMPAGAPKYRYRLVLVPAEVTAETELR